jgi:membrane-bound lytic murein transglycosylase A
MIAIPNALSAARSRLRSPDFSGRARARLTVAVFALLAGCAVVPTAPTATPPPPATPAPAPEITPSPPPTVPAAPQLVPVSFADLPGWLDDEVAPAFLAFLQGCPAIRSQPLAAICARAQPLATAPAGAQRAFVEAEFVPNQVVAADGKTEGLLTGYYEPLLRGSRRPEGRYRFPVYGPPEDLVSVELAELYPELKGLRLRGRLVGRKVVPYWARADIDNDAAPLKGRELAWVDDPVELFFLQVQGSGRVRLDSGEVVRVGYADQNGHPYRSIGRLLVERGELTLDKASMQGIRAWGRDNPQKLPALLAENPSYVFFRELPAGNGGPIGALGVPLTTGRSLAVDARTVPLGAPVFVASTWPGSDAPLVRLMVAQDTGGAIKGAIRADFFWGFGDEAGELAGRTRQPLRMWVLLPRAK